MRRLPRRRRHVVPTDTAAAYLQNPDTMLAGINLAITSVTNTNPGQTPTVNFTLQFANIARPNRNSRVPPTRAVLALSLAGGNFDGRFCSVIRQMKFHCLLPFSQSTRTFRDTLR